MATNQIDVERKLLILAIIFFPITNFRITLPITDKVLSGFFLLIGLAISLYKLFLEQDKLDKFERFSLFYLLAYFVWQCICCIVGVQEYAYYHLINLEQMDKLRVLLQELFRIGINFSDLTAIKAWFILVFIKSCIWNLFLTYSISFWVYHIYTKIKDSRKRIKRIFDDLIMAVTVLCIVLIIYSFFEIGYLRGNQFCAELLKTINPYLYEPQQGVGWWPPLLWSGRLRSLFVEPSYLGVFGVLIVPVLFYKLLISKTVFFSMAYGMFMVMLFLTRSRLAIIIYLIQFSILIVYLCLLNRVYLKNIIKVVFINIVSFGISIYLISGFATYSVSISDSPNISEQNVVATYINDNITSVIGKDKRSNSARYAALRAAFLTGVENPFYGVGMLPGAYICNHFTDEDLNDYEVKYTWVEYLNKLGPYKFNGPNCGQLFFELAKFGIVGLLFYLLPFIYFISFLLKTNKIWEHLSLELACIIIAYIGSFISISNSLPFFVYYILTGFMLVSLQSIKEECSYV